MDLVSLLTFKKFTNKFGKFKNQASIITWPQKNLLDKQTTKDH